MKKIIFLSSIALALCSTSVHSMQQGNFEKGQQIVAVYSAGLAGYAAVTYFTTSQRNQPGIIDIFDTTGMALVYGGSAAALGTAALLKKFAPEQTLNARTALVTFGFTASTAYTVALYQIAAEVCQSFRP